MRNMTMILLSLTLLGSTSAHAISAKYRQQLEHSGCTQASELQGCDIHKSKAENAKAGFVTEAAKSAPAQKGGSSYKQQLERSGCTQASELQGCDIHKSKAENTQAGFVTAATGKSGLAKGSSYVGKWVAKTDSGDTVATIRIDGNDQVWINGKKFKAKKSDGALVFRDGTITYTIQGDRRIEDEDAWVDSDAGTSGAIIAQ